MTMQDDQSTTPTDDKSHYTGAILEDIQHQVQRLAEAMADVPAKVTSIDVRLARVEEKVDVIEAAVTDQSRQLANHETRITKLETVT